MYLGNVHIYELLPLLYKLGAITTTAKATFSSLGESNQWATVLSMLHIHSGFNGEWSKLRVRQYGANYLLENCSLHNSFVNKCKTTPIESCKTTPIEGCKSIWKY